MSVRIQRLKESKFKIKTTELVESDENKKTRVRLIFATTVMAVQRGEHLYGLVSLSKPAINTKNSEGKQE